MDSNKILDLQLVQSNEVGGSYHMEKEGLRRSLDHLQSNGLAVDYIVTDRHPQIQKFLRDLQITHFYDVWHFEKGLSKKLQKLAKNKDCQILNKWLHAIKNHVYYSATSSTSGREKVANWTSMINHMQDVHTHDNPIYPKCAHADRVSKDKNKWFQPDVMNKEVVGSLRQKYPEINDVHLAKNATIKGISYKIGMLIPYGSTGGLPGFADILQICIVERSLSFVVRVLFAWYREHFRAYELTISPNREVALVHLENLADAYPLCDYTVVVKRMVTLKRHIIV
ncbi:hypothetical protein JOB18_020270 [Solea senegalensis]|uniref:Uncharacterized protein n=1 Tax=Solea senegalensis TaxID=28829 RepID=A0AAV6PBE3_SOLSE|nr:hypothetical protein JOB18_020270 [Solea senegalensis]